MCLASPKIKICRNQWMDKRSCRLARCHESECLGLFNPNRTVHNHSKIFARNENDRTVLITLPNSTAKWWNSTSSMSRRQSFSFHKQLLSGLFFFTSLTSIIITWWPPKKFCTHHSVEPHKNTSNRVLQLLQPALSTSDVVETVTFETDTWIKLRYRERDFIKNFETETRDLKIYGFCQN